MHQFEDIDRIIFLYLSGNANAKEVKVLKKWITESSSNKKQFNHIKDYWNNNHLKIELDKGENLYKKLKDIIYNPDLNYKEKVKPIFDKKEKNFYWFKIAGIAASLLLLVSIWIYFSRTQLTKNEPYKEIVTVIKENPAGQKSNIMLPDGSLVWLNSKSSIKYPQQFNSSHRDIELTGEAYFDVIHDPSRPFIVHSNKFDVTVLGTKFNVKSFSSDQNSRISLIEGRVKVTITDDTSKQFEPTFLNPGEELSYNPLSQKINKHKFDKDDITAWKDGILILKSNNFSELKENLETWYGVTIILKGTPPDNFVVTGYFDNESLSNVLKTLQFGREFEYNIKDNIITIIFKQNFLNS